MQKLKKTTLYDQAFEFLQKSILDGKFTIGDYMPPERTLCEELGISRFTLRHALGRLENDGVIERTPGRGSVIRSIPELKRKTIGVINVMQGVLFLDRVNQKLLETIKTKEGKAVFCKSEPDVESVKNTIMSIQKSISGIIIGAFFSNRHQNACLQYLKEINIPFVVMHGKKDNDINAVLVNHYPGMADGIKHLKDLGHENVAFLGLTGEGYIRHQYFKEILADLNLPLREELMVSCSGIMKEGYEKVDELLDAPSPPTAIIAHNDLVALGAMQKIKKRGLRISEDISIIGLDNLDESLYSSPALTTIEQNKKALGEAAIEILWEKMENPDKPPVNKIIDTHLIVRESTGYAATLTNKKQRKSAK